MGKSADDGAQDSDLLGNEDNKGDEIDIAKLLDSPDDDDKGGEGDDEGAGDEGDKGKEGDAGDDKDKGKGKEGDDKGEKDDETPSEIDLLKQENLHLRQSLRDNRRTQKDLEVRLGKIERKAERTEKKVQDGLENLDDDGTGDKKGKTEDDEDTPSDYEVLQDQYVELATRRSTELSAMADLMSDMPQYKDVNEVCSKSNVEDLVEVVAARLAKEHKIDQSEAALLVELNIWSKPNPYKYLYKVLKEHHPKYRDADAGDKDKGDKGKEGDKGKGKDKGDAGKGGDKEGKKPVKTASSISNMGGGDSDSQSGWTAEKIDNMPEEQLHKVPSEIYEKYLQGLLE